MREKRRKRGRLHVSPKLRWALGVNMAPLVAAMAALPAGFASGLQRVRVIA